jgi:hypothetical protein
MLAAATQTVTDLNTRARDHRIRTGQVVADRVRLSDGTTAAAGDVVVTRLSQRSLTAGRGWVQNGDDWLVRHIRDDGSLEVGRAGGGTTVVLPADYVREHVELGYTSTAHRAQGRTVETHTPTCQPAPRANPSTSWQPEGAETNRLYLDTAHEPDAPSAYGHPEQVEPIDVLQKTIAASTAEVSVTEVRRRQHQLQHARTLSGGLRRTEPGYTGPNRDLL